MFSSCWRSAEPRHSNRNISS